MEVDEGSNKKSDICPHWMAAHARLKNEFTEYVKCHNLMSWLKFLLFFGAGCLVLELSTMTSMMEMMQTMMTQARTMKVSRKQVKVMRKPTE